jgi:glycosyltransferase involved in cell wall biosynthesis
VFAFEMQAAPAWRALFLLAERLAARWTDLLVCVSEAEARAAALLGRGCPPVRVVHNGVEVSAACAPLPLDALPLRALLPGRVCRQKGQDTLAEALLRHPELAASFQVELVGADPAGPLPKAVRRAAQAGLCRLRPACPPGEVAALLERAAVVVLPSRWEGMPYTLLEAMAAGRCVLASAVGGVPEAVTDGVNGLLIPPEEPAALAAALFQIAAAPEQARAWGLAARETVLRKFRRDAMLAALSELYEGERG